MIVEPVTLAGRAVRLEPLSLSHHAQLCEVGLDEELWTWIAAPVRTVEDMRAYIEAVLRDQASGTALPFAIVATGGNTPAAAVGCTRYGNIDRTNRHVEIGWTWIAKAWQRTA